MSGIDKFRTAFNAMYLVQAVQSLETDTIQFFIPKEQKDSSFLEEVKGPESYSQSWLIAPVYMDDIEEKTEEMEEAEA